MEGTVIANGSPAADALTGITGYAGFVVREDQPDVHIRETGDGFEPRVVVLTYGQAIVVENATSEVRHPMLEQQPHQLSVAPRSAIRLHPKLPGRYRLVDESRSADVYVANTPLHATTDSHGHFRISRVPVGKLHVHASYADHQTEGPIDVTDNAVTSVTLTIPQ